MAGAYAQNAGSDSELHEPSRTVHQKRRVRVARRKASQTERGQRGAGAARHAMRRKEHYSADVQHHEPHPLYTPQSTEDRPLHCRMNDIRVCESLPRTSLIQHQHQTMHRIILDVRGLGNAIRDYHSGTPRLAYAQCLGLNTLGNKKEAVKLFGLEQPVYE